MQRRELIEASNSADSVAAETDKAIKEFREQVDAEEAKKVEGLVAELRELAIKSQGDGEGITAAQIKEKISETQQASLNLFQKVYQARNAQGDAAPEAKPEEKAEESKEPKKE